MYLQLPDEYSVSNLTGRGTRNHWRSFSIFGTSCTGFLLQAMDAAQLADDLKAQLELAQKKLHDFQDEIVENRVTREKEMFNFKRAEVYIYLMHNPLIPVCFGVCPLVTEFGVGFSYTTFLGVQFHFDFSFISFVH